MPQSSSFEVIYLGDLAVVDTREGNTTISQTNGEKLLGTYGSATDPLSNEIHLFNPGSTGYIRGSGTGYESDNDVYNEKFVIDRGSDQTFDVSILYSGTITYTDGETVPVDTFGIFQDINGKTYLAPRDGTGSPLGVKPIEYQSGRSDQYRRR